MECFQFSVNLFSSNCWFYYLVVYKLQQRNLEFWTYFSVISFLCSAAKETFQTQLFKTLVLTQPDFEKPKKIHFKPEKGHFWFTLRGPWTEEKKIRSLRVMEGGTSISATNTSEKRKQQLPPHISSQVLTTFFSLSQGRRKVWKSGGPAVMWWA